MNVGDRIKMRRKEIGMSQTELAEKVGSTKQNIYKYENGIITNIPSDKIEAIAAALAISPGTLMGWENNKSSLTLIDFPHLQRIPILGRIAAGVPIYAEENIEGYTYTDLNGGAEYFGLRVRGDSMDAARIHDGDIVIIRRQDIVENGEIAAVLIDDQDATLKRFSRHGDIVTLMPQSTNPVNQPFVYNLKETAVKILGLVVKVEFRPQ